MPTTPSDASSTEVTSQRSDTPVPRTMDRLEAAVRAKGLTVFARIDHAAGARAAGLAMQEAQVLIFGNAKAGTPLMVARPLVALDLPLRVLVWADAAGQVWVSYNALAYYARRFELPAGLEQNLAAVQGLVESALHGPA